MLSKCVYTIYDKNNDNKSESSTITFFISKIQKSYFFANLAGIDDAFVTPTDRRSAGRFVADGSAPLFPLTNPGLETRRCSFCAADSRADAELVVELGTLFALGAAATERAPAFDNVRRAKDSRVSVELRSVNAAVVVFIRLVVEVAAPPLVMLRPIVPQMLLRRIMPADWPAVRSNWIA